MLQTKDLVLLVHKGLSSDEYMNGLQKMYEADLHPKDNFESNLSQSAIPDALYVHAGNV